MLGEAIFGAIVAAAWTILMVVFHFQMRDATSIVSLTLVGAALFLVTFILVLSANRMAQRIEEWLVRRVKNGRFND